MMYRLSDIQVDIMIESLKIVCRNFQSVEKIIPPNVLNSLEQFQSAKIIMEDIPKEQRYLYLFIGRKPV